MNMKKLLVGLTGILVSAVLLTLTLQPADAATTNFRYYSYTPYGSTYNSSPHYFVFRQSNPNTPSQPQTSEPKPAEPTVPSQPTQPKNPPQTQPSPPATTSPQLGQFEQRVVELVNVERSKAGLKPLQADPQLSDVARLKSQDMRDKNYFSHTSPTYGSPFEMMRQFGISYRYAGENIAAGQRTPEQVVQAWMNSSGHRANILNKNYTNIGVGYASGGSYGNYWTQMFIGK